MGEQMGADIWANWKEGHYGIQEWKDQNAPQKVQIIIRRTLDIAVLQCTKL